jgi:hypothetical protein
MNGFGADSLRPRQVPHEPFPDGEWRTYQFSVGETLVRVKEDFTQVQILIQGVLPEELVRRIVEGIASNIESLNNGPCKVVEL